MEKEIIENPKVARSKLKKRIIVLPPENQKTGKKY
jgi:hypothetical protein